MKDYEKSIQFASDQKYCALCGQPFSSYKDMFLGFPLTENMVCTTCNMDKVIPKRLQNLYKLHGE